MMEIKGTMNKMMFSKLSNPFAVFSSKLKSVNETTIKKSV